MNNQISFKELLSVCCPSSREWLKCYHTKGLRWLITHVMDYKLEWMQNECSFPATNVAIPAGILNSLIINKTSPVAEACLQIRELYDQTNMGCLTREIIDILDRFEICDQLAD